MPKEIQTEHTFKLSDNLNGTTTFIQSKRFSGIPVPLFLKLIDKNTREGFILMNRQLKEIAVSMYMSGNFAESSMSPSAL